MCFKLMVVLWHLTLCWYRSAT